MNFRKKVNGVKLSPVADDDTAALEEEAVCEMVLSGMCNVLVRMTKLYVPSSFSEE